MEAERHAQKGNEEACTKLLLTKPLGRSTGASLRSPLSLNVCFLIGGAFLPVHCSHVLLWFMNQLGPALSPHPGSFSHTCSLSYVLISCALSFPVVYLGDLTVQSSFLTFVMSELCPEWVMWPPGARTCGHPPHPAPLPSLALLHASAQDNTWEPGRVRGTALNRVQEWEEKSLMGHILPGLI